MENKLNDEFVKGVIEAGKRKLAGVLDLLGDGEDDKDNKVNETGAIEGKEEMTEDDNSDERQDERDRLEVEAERAREIEPKEIL